MRPRAGLLGARGAGWIGAFGLAIAIVAAAAVAHAVTIDFSTIDSTVASGNIDRIAPATFSHNLYTFDDGFQPYLGRAYNYYGEDGEFIVFDAPVFLTSLDVQFPFIDLPVPTSVTEREGRDDDRISESCDDRSLHRSGRHHGRAGRRAGRGRDLPGHRLELRG